MGYLYVGYCYVGYAMLRVVDIGFIWLSLISSIVILAAYGTQRWYRNSIGRFIVALKVVVFGVYLRAAITTITHPEVLRTDIGNVCVTGVLALILAYGAWAFVTTIRQQRDDDGNDDGDGQA